MQEAVAIAQFLGQLIVMMPRAVETVKFASDFPRFGVDVAIPVTKPFYAQFGACGHINSS
jgi:hypothetical protein